jgi:hypothetical protein
MSLSKEDWISQRAYAIWETEGRPHDRGAENWQQAATEYEQLEQTRASTDGNELIEMLRAAGRLMRAADNDVLRDAPERTAAAKATVKR